MNTVKLARFNDWGVVYFAIPGKGLSPQGTSSVRDYALRFKAGAQLHVRWPDGTWSLETVTYKEMHDEVQDMGHRYPVSYGLPGIMTSSKGVEHWVPLDAVELSEASLPNSGDTK